MDQSSLMRITAKYAKQTALSTIGRVKSFGKQKIFCVGRNKTGTTSIHRAMMDLGYRAGNQRQAELLFRDWARRDFRKLKSYCKTAEFFQDIPFSLPYTFQSMDMCFPGSKFILTERDPEQWYSSMKLFHLKSSVHGDKALSLEALKDATYCYKGFAYETKVLVYDLPGDDPYDRDTLIEHYLFHNKMVKDYFRNRPNDLLVIDVTSEGAYQELCEFLGKKPLYESFPWENKT